MTKIYLTNSANTIASQGPYYIEISSAKIEYVNDDQTLEDIGHMDVHKMSDGEIVLVYGAPVTKYEIDGKTENSREDNNEWEKQSGTFMTGSANEGLLWGCPIVKNMNFNDDDKYQWPMMVMGGVEFEIRGKCRRENGLRLLRGALSLVRFFGQTKK